MLSHPGQLLIYPRVSDKVVQKFNALAQEPNNAFGQGSELSFDAALHGLSSKSHRNRARSFERDKDTIKLSRVPSNWCGWLMVNAADTDFTAICHNGPDKLYAYRPWLHYTISTFLLHHAGVRIDRIAGEIEWQGEKAADSGKLGVCREGEVWRVQASRFSGARATFSRFKSRTDASWRALSWLAVARGTRVVYEEAREAVREDDHEVVSFDAKATALNWASCSDDETEIAHPCVSRSVYTSDLLVVVAQAFPFGVRSLVLGYFDDGARICSGCGKQFVGPAAAWTCHWFIETSKPGELYVGRYCSRACIGSRT